MSDLTGGRAHNGGARSGPIPSSSSGGGGGSAAPAPVRTPRQIMNDRAAREARRQEEQRVEEQKRLMEARRISAERRAAATNTSAPRVSGSSSQYSPDVSQQQPQATFIGGSSDRGRVANSGALGEPTGRTSVDYSAPGRSRAGPTLSQPDQPRGATSAPTGRRVQTAPGSSSRQPPPDPTPAASSGGGGARSGPSSFPHAFERWETLSSHWEGLTSYWLRKLEQNYEEIKDTVPNAVTLNRQITDLSAAGANLFHAVVELQRLRASSERKFQRWFFETRAENERNREIQAQVENQLKLEREGREDAARMRSEAAMTAETTRREIAEMRRELIISKDEARRAWEELGRRNQEALEIQESLKLGKVTKVGNIDVRPYISEQYYTQGGSPTNTDPFTEAATPSQSQRRYEPMPTSLAAGLYQPQQPSAVASSSREAYPEQRPPPASAGSLSGGGPQEPSSSAARSVPPSQQAPRITSQEAQRFYQHSPQETFLHSPTAGASGPTTGSGGIMPREEVRSQASYASDAAATEYAIDPQGNIRRDDNGQPIVFRRVSSPPTAGVGPTGGGGRGAAASYRHAEQILQQQQQQQQRQEIPEEDDEDDYDSSADVRREAELAARFAGVAAPDAPPTGGSSSVPMSGVAPQSMPPSSAAAMAAASSGGGRTAGSSGGTGGGDRGGGDVGGPDYEGEGFGDGDDWTAMQQQHQAQLQGRHHHPTRLSDVREEDEESSSRRTGD